MKKYIKKLSEKYPVLEQTNFILMLVLGGVVHIAFFVYGFMLINDPKIFQSWAFPEKHYEKTNLLYVGCAISVTLLVFWVALIRRKKTFKNFLQLSNKKVLLQFLSYFFIIFWVSSFYFSFNIGKVLGISSKYTKKELYNDMDIVNKASIFLNVEPKDYSLANRVYGFPFDELVASRVRGTGVKDYFLNSEKEKFQFWSVTETEEFYKKSKDYSGSHILKKRINKDSTKIYITHRDKPVIVIRNPFDSISGDYVIYKELDVKVKADKTENTPKYLTNYADDLKLSQPNFDVNTGKIIYKENGVKKELLVKIKDFPKYQLFSDESYYAYKLRYVNYSSIRFSSSSTTGYKFKIPQGNYNGVHNKQKYYMNKFVYELLNDENNKERIKKILDDFITLTNKYKIDRNIDAKEWFGFVYNKHFSVTRGIYIGSKTDDDILYYYQATSDDDAFIKHISLTGTLNSILLNLDFKRQAVYLFGKLNIFVWIAFFLSVLLFAFRISRRKAFVISAFLILIIWVVSDWSLSPASALSYPFNKEGFSDVYISAIVIMLLFIGFIIAPYYLIKKSTFFSTIFLNLRMFFFVPLLYLVFHSISSLQVLSTKTGSEYFPRYEYNDILTKLGGYVHIIFLIIGVVFIYFTIPLIKTQLKNNKKSVNK